MSSRSNLKHLKEAILAYEKKLATRKLVPGPALTPVVPPITLPGTSVAYASTATSTEGIPYSDRKCTECGKTGHFVDKCWFARPELHPKHWKDPRENERNKYKVHKKGKDKDHRRQAGDRRRPSKSSQRHKTKYESPSASSSSDSSDSDSAPPKSSAKMALGVPCT